MNFNLDEAIAINEVLPWDFSISIGGTSHSVRPLLNKDVIRLKTIEELPVEKQYESIAGLFESPPPAVDQWNDAQATAAIAAIIGYVNGRAAKNFRRIVAQVSATTAAAK